MRSSWASQTIQSVCIHCVAESPVYFCDSQLSSHCSSQVSTGVAILSTPLCVSLGTRCCYIWVNLALDVPVSLPWPTSSVHLPVGLVVIHSSNLAWYLVYLALLYILPCIRLKRGRRRFYVSPHRRLLAVARFTLLKGFPVGCKLPFVYPQFPYMIGFVPDNWTNCLASVLSVMRFRCLDVVLCISRDRDWLRRGHPDRGTDAWSLACSRGHRGLAACVYHGSRIT